MVGAGREERLACPPSRFLVFREVAENSTAHSLMPGLSPLEDEHAIPEEKLRFVLVGTGNWLQGHLLAQGKAGKRLPDSIGYICCWNTVDPDFRAFLPLWKNRS